MRARSGLLSLAVVVIAALLLIRYKTRPTQEDYINKVVEEYGTYSLSPQGTPEPTIMVPHASIGMIRSVNRKFTPRTLVTKDRWTCSEHQYPVDSPERWVIFSADLGEPLECHWQPPVKLEATR